MSDFYLKKYISHDFRDPEHKGQSLIEIFLNDPSYYDYLLDNHVPDARAAYFIAKYADQIRDTKNSGRRFQKILCYQLADELLTEFSLDQITWDMVAEAKENNTQSDTSEQQTDQNNTKGNPWNGLDIKYPIHNRKLRFVKMMRNKGHGSSHSPVPVFKCPVCGRMYTYVDFLEYKSSIRLRKKLITNIYPSAVPEPASDSVELNNTETNTSEPSDEKETNQTRRRCFVYTNTPPENCMNGSCNAMLKPHFEPLFNAEHVQKSYVIKTCPDCGVVYLRASLQATNSDQFDVISTVPEHTKQVDNKPDIRVSHFEKNGAGSSKAEHDNYSSLNARNLKEITGQDFVIWKNSFNCHNKGHKVQEIDALITVIKRNGDLIQCEIAASYCKQCKKYFILEGTYKELLRYGTIACRVTDEKTYLQEINKNPSNGGFSLAPESILKQCGYSVSQSSTLTAKQRLDILKLIIDNNICSKDKVLSHLDYLISWFGKQKGHKNDLAISKWKSDRDSISRYRVGSNRKVVVKVIKIKKPLR